MKESIETAIRHSLTALAGLGAFLVSQGWLDAADAPAVNAAGVQISDALGVIVAALAMRGLIYLAGKMTKFSGSGVGMAWLLVAGTAVGCMALPSCSADQRAALQAVPVKACYIDSHGYRVCYSTRDGIEAEVDQRSGK